MFDVCPYSRGDVLSQRVMVGNDKWSTVTRLIFSKWMLRSSIFVNYNHDLCTAMHFNFGGYLIIHQRLELILQLILSSEMPRVTSDPLLSWSFRGSPGEVMVIWSDVRRSHFPRYQQPP